MAISATGFQTGIDTDLSELSNITGVIVATDGNVTTYTFPATITTALRIRGTLSHNTELERIIFQRPINAESNSPLIFIEGGTYNFGIEKSPGVFTDGVGIQINGGGSIWYNGGFNSGSTSVNGTMMTVGSNAASTGVALGGTLNINGGRIAGQFHITVRPSGVINNTYNAKFLVDASSQTLGTEWLSRFYGGTFGTTNFAYEGGSISLGNGSHGRTLTFDRSAAGVGYWAQHANGTNFRADDPDTYPTIRNVSFNGNAVDIAAWSSQASRIGAVRVQNCGNGTNININGGETIGDNANNGGYIWVTKQIDTNFLALADQSNVVGTVRAFDTDRQSDITLPIASVATGAISYKGETNGSLTSWVASGTGAGVTAINTEGDNEVALAFWSLLHDDNDHARGTIDTGDWAVDRRSNGGVIGIDEFTFYTYAYGFNPIVTTQDLAGTGILTLNENFIADANITETSFSTALAYTGIVTTNTSVVVSEDRSLDQLYDKAMADKVSNDALSTSAATSADWLFSTTSGSTLTLDGAKTISIGANTLLRGSTHQTLASTAVVTINGTGFNGITFNGATTGNFGAIVGSNITTSDPGAEATPPTDPRLPITIASIDNSDIDAVGSLSITGALTGTGTVTSDGIITLSNSAAASDYEFDAPTISGVNTGTFVDGITFRRAGGDLAMAVNFVVDAGEYTIDNLLGTNFSFEPGDVITLNSTNEIDVVVPNKSTINFTAGDNVTVIEADSMLDFSQYTMNDSTWANNIKISYSLANDISNPILLAAGNVVALSASTFVAGSDYIFTITKPGWTSSRMMITYAPGSTYTATLNAIDAVSTTANITGVTFTYDSKTSDQIKIIMNGAPTSNALDGIRSVWAIEQVKNIQEYNFSVHTYGTTNLNIAHPSSVETLWDGDYMLLEPGTQNQQVLGWRRSNQSAPIIADNSSNLSIFINGSTEVNYDSVGTALDNTQTAARVTSLRTNKLLGLKPQSATSGGDFVA